MSNLLQMPQRRSPVHRCAESMWTPGELTLRRRNGTFINGPGLDDSNERVINGIALAVFAGVMVLLGYWLCR